MSDSDEIEMVEVQAPKPVTSKHFSGAGGAAAAPPAAAAPKRKPSKKVIESEDDFEAESSGSDYEGAESESEGEFRRRVPLARPIQRRSPLLLSRREAEGEGEGGGQGCARGEEAEECAHASALTPLARSGSLSQRRRTRALRRLWHRSPPRLTRAPRLSHRLSDATLTAEGAAASPLKEVKAKLSSKEKLALEKKTELEGYPAAVRVTGALSEADYFARRGAWEARKGSEMKELLKHNSQLFSGTKLELAVRCTEFEALGGMPKCPHCKSGAVMKVDVRPTLSAGQQVFVCKGGRQGGEEGADSAAYIPCGFSVWARDFARLPWVGSLDQPPPQQPPPPAGAAAAAAAPIPELDPSEAGDLVVAVGRVMEQVAKEGLAVPKDASALRSELAGLISAHRDAVTNAFDLKAVMAKLQAKYARAAKGMGALVAANDALADAFDAIAAESDDAFKRNTFKTCSAAIRAWPTAIKKGTELSAGAKKVKGVGASCAKLIDAFIAEGKFPPKEPGK